MFAVFAAVLCLASLSHSVPVPCEILIRPLPKPDLSPLWGRWALVAGSLNDSVAADVLRTRQSSVIDLHNSSYTQGNRKDDECQYLTRNLGMDGDHLRMLVGAYNFTGTLFHSPCPDCVTLRLDVEAPNYKTSDLYLLSKRREVDETEMEEFKNQVDCLNLAAPIIMNGTQELCPEQAAGEPDAKPEEKKDLK